jgi:hypothetical protein
MASWLKKRIFAACLAVAALFCGLPAYAAAAAQAPLLPEQFGGWTMQGSPQVSRDPAAADGANAALLKEYGFTDFAGAHYAREDGRKLTVRVARFADATGAYGAFTFYKSPEMLNEKFGDQGASLNNRILFYRGNSLVDAVFDRLSVMSAAEMRELAGLLPMPSGTAANLPVLPTYLPRSNYVKNSAKYVVGPIGLGKIDSPVPASAVDFSTGAELVSGEYDTSAGNARLTLISYPTPQIAAAHLKQVEDGHRAELQTPGSATILDASPLFARRTGPILVIASGPLSQSEATALMATVNYDADVTWNENTHFTKKDNLANLLVNIILLCGILIAFALLSGVAFAGFRMVMGRLFPHRVFDRPEAAEFISLHLDEGPQSAPQPR